MTLRLRCPDKRQLESSKPPTPSASSAPVLSSTLPSTALPGATSSSSPTAPAIATATPAEDEKKGTETKEPTTDAAASATTDLPDPPGVLVSTVSGSSSSSSSTTAAAGAASHRVSAAMLLPAVTFVHKYYPLPLDLCRRYARMLFFARYRFDKRTLACLSYSDFDFVAHVLIAEWGTNGAPSLLFAGPPTAGATGAAGQAATAATVTAAAAGGGRPSAQQQEQQQQDQQHQQPYGQAEESSIAAEVAREIADGWPQHPLQAYYKRLEPIADELAVAWAAEQAKAQVAQQRPRESAPSHTGGARAVLSRLTRGALFGDSSKGSGHGGSHSRRGPPRRRSKAP